jgi:hypothetical protein
MAVAESAAVLVRDSTLLGGASNGAFGYAGSTALSQWNSSVTLKRCSITGGAGGNANPTFRLSATGGGAGVSIAGGEVQVEQCTVTGGPGGSASGGWAPAAGGRGLVAYGANLLVSGGCAVSGGPHGLPSSGAPNSAIVGDQQFPTAVRVTSDCTLTGATSHLAVIPPIPHLVSPGTAWLGGKADLTLRGPAGTAALLLLDFAHAHVVVPGIDGALLLPPASLMGLFPVSIGSGGSLALSFPVPIDPVLRNQFAFFQAAGVAPGGALPFLTNLGDFRLR